MKSKTAKKDTKPTIAPIKAFVNDDNDTYSYLCPKCDTYNDVEDDFVWNGPSSRNEMSTYCPQCKDKRLIYR